MKAEEILAEVRKVGVELRYQRQVEGFSTRRPVLSFRSAIIAQAPEIKALLGSQNTLSRMSESDERDRSGPKGSPTDAAPALR